MADVRTCDVCGKPSPIDKAYTELPAEGWFRITGCHKTGGFSTYPRFDCCSIACMGVLAAKLAAAAIEEIPQESQRVDVETESSVKADGEVSRA